MALQRRIPTYRDLAPLMQFKKPDLDAKRRRLSKALTVYDLERLQRAPHRLVLSSCESGLSAVHAGDELMGFTELKQGSAGFAEPPGSEALAATAGEGEGSGASKASSPPSRMSHTSSRISAFSRPPAM